MFELNRGVAMPERDRLKGKIRDLEGQIVRAPREMSRVRTQIKGLESEIRSMSSMK